MMLRAMRNVLQQAPLNRLLFCACHGCTAPAAAAACLISSATYSFAECEQNSNGSSGNFDSSYIELQTAAHASS